MTSTILNFFWGLFACCWIQSMTLGSHKQQWNESTTQNKTRNYWNILSASYLNSAEDKMEKFFFSFSIFLLYCFLHSNISQEIIQTFFSLFSICQFGVFFHFSLWKWTEKSSPLNFGLVQRLRRVCLHLPFFCLLLFLFFHFIWFLSSSVRLKNYCSK